MALSWLLHILNTHNAMKAQWTVYVWTMPEETHVHTQHNVITDSGKQWEQEFLEQWGFDEGDVEFQWVPENPFSHMVGLRLNGKEIVAVIEHDTSTVLALDDDTEVVIKPNT